MPKNPSRPRDPNQLARSIVDIASGEAEDADKDAGKDPTAAASRRDGKEEPRGVEPFLQGGFDFSGRGLLGRALVRRAWISDPTAGGSTPLRSISTNSIAGGAKLINVTCMRDRIRIRCARPQRWPLASRTRCLGSIT